MSDVPLPSATVRPEPAADRRRGGTRRGVMIFFLCAAAASGIGFAVKIYQFAQDMLQEHGIGFAGAHLMTYACVALGFLLLLAGTFFRGHYAEIEKPKYDLLERELMHDRLERPAARG